MHLLLIDGLNFVRRLYAAIVGERTPDDDLCRQFRAACDRSLLRALHDHHPTHGICVFDSGQPHWRHREFPDYKANRKPMPDSLATLLPENRRDFALLGVQSYTFEDCEADDVLASIVARIPESAGSVTLLSTDKSMCQLLRPNVQVYDHFNRRYLDEAWIGDKFGISANHVDTFFALAGDRSLNIPGVPGIGYRTAAKLVNDWGDLEQILAHIEDIPGKVGRTPEHSGKPARLARRLVRFRSDLRRGVNLKDFRLPDPLPSPPY